MSEEFYRPKKKRKKIIHVMPLNLAPLIDINANLLFFLIVANSVQEDRLQAGKEVELPKSSSSTAEAGDLVSVVVSMNCIPRKAGGPSRSSLIVKASWPFRMRDIVRSGADWRRL